MDQLPELVKSALSIACKSGKSLSWKLQESSKGLLIQLVWRNRPEQPASGGMTVGVGSKWNSQGVKKSNKPFKKRISPSRAKRSDRRLQAFLDKKQGNLVSQKVAEPDTLPGYLGPCQDILDPPGQLSDSSELESDGCEEGVDLMKCDEVNFEERDGVPGVTFVSKDDDTRWTPVTRRRRKIDRHCEDNLDVKGAREVYYTESGNLPMLYVRRGCTNRNVENIPIKPSPIAARRLKGIKSPVPPLVGVRPSV